MILIELLLIFIYLLLIFLFILRYQKEKKLLNNDFKSYDLKLIFVNFKDLILYFINYNICLLISFYFIEFVYIKILCIIFLFLIGVFVLISFVFFARIFIYKKILKKNIKVLKDSANRVNHFITVILGSKNFYIMNEISKSASEGFLISKDYTIDSLLYMNYCLKNLEVKTVEDEKFIELSDKLIQNAIKSNPKIKNIYKEYFKEDKN